MTKAEFLASYFMALSGIVLAVPFIAVVGLMFTLGPRHVFATVATMLGR